MNIKKPQNYINLGTRTLTSFIFWETSMYTRVCMRLQYLRMCCVRLCMFACLFALHFLQPLPGKESLFKAVVHHVGDKVTTSLLFHLPQIKSHIFSDWNLKELTKDLRSPPQVRISLCKPKTHIHILSQIRTQILNVAPHTPGPVGTQGGASELNLERSWHKLPWPSEAPSTPH